MLRSTTIGLTAALLLFARTVSAGILDDPPPTFEGDAPGQVIYRMAPIYSDPGWVDTIVTCTNLSDRDSWVAFEVFGTEAEQTPPCVGDCSGDGVVTVDELVIGINIALSQAPMDECPSLDSDSDDGVMINEIVKAVAGALTDCGTRSAGVPGLPFGAHERHADHGRQYVDQRVGEIALELVSPGETVTFTTSPMLQLDGVVRVADLPRLSQGKARISATSAQLTCSARHCIQAAAGMMKERPLELIKRVHFGD